MLVGALAASMAFTGCKPEGNAAAARASGSVALTNDDSEILAVDTDNNVLVGFNASTHEISRTVAVGQSPARVIVDANDTAFVTNKGSRTVSVIRKEDTTTASASIDVGVEPAGMAITPDGRTLLVVSATALDKTETGLLTAIDTNTLAKKWEIEVGEEPRGVAVITGNRALVTLVKQGELVQVDLAKGTVIPGTTGTIYNAANQTKISGTVGSSFAPTSAFSSFRPRALNEIIVTPDGDRAFAPVTWAREDNIAKRPSVAGGYYAAGGPCNIGAVATAGIVTVDTTPATPAPQVDDLTSCFTGSGTVTSDKDYPVSTLASGAANFPALQGATTAALDPTGEWLVVVNRETRNMAWMPAWKRTGTQLDVDTTGSSIRSVQDLGVHGVDGVALSRDGNWAFVYSQFEHKLVAFKGGGADTTAVITEQYKINVPDNSEFGKDIARVEGRKLFFDAKDTRISGANTNVACSSCHLEGREDGHIWQFPDGSRQTPALAGRKLLSTAPFHWSGEFATISQFNTHTITERMGGSGLNGDAASQLDAFIDQMPLADNPMKSERFSAQLQRGAAAFDKAQCSTCHTANNGLFTNNENRDVGTLRIGGTNPDQGITKGFNVPSLLGVGRTAPYLHDGSQLTLSARVFNNDVQHGSTNLLADDEKADLLVYLRSL
ncbi:MAG: c-type cytochrome [Archangium sp.]